MYSVCPGVCQECGAHVTWRVHVVSCTRLHQCVAAAPKPLKSWSWFWEWGKTRLYCKAKHSNTARRHFLEGRGRCSEKRGHCQRKKKRREGLANLEEIRSNWQRARRSGDDSGCQLPGLHVATACTGRGPTEGGHPQGRGCHATTREKMQQTQCGSTGRGCTRGILQVRWRAQGGSADSVVTWSSGDAEIDNVASLTHELSHTTLMELQLSRSLVPARSIWMVVWLIPCRLHTCATAMHARMLGKMKQSLLERANFQKTG